MRGVDEHGVLVCMAGWGQHNTPPDQTSSGCTSLYGRLWHATALLSIVVASMSGFQIEWFLYVVGSGALALCFLEHPAVNQPPF
jgi:hypothetical protein